MSEVLTAQDVRRQAAYIRDWRRNLNGPPPELIRLRRELEDRDAIIAELQRNAAEPAVAIEALRLELQAAKEKIAKLREIVRKLDGDEFMMDSPKAISVRDIKKAVCQHYKLAPGELESPRRSHPLVHYRLIAMYLCKKLTTRSLPEIGRAFGDRDHSTVINAVRRVEGFEPHATVGLLTTNPKIKEEIETIKKRLGVTVDA
jgi:chromosomal replication initiation ATPase DnaA